jgi:hypothetical protein
MKWFKKKKEREDLKLKVIKANRKAIMAETLEDLKKLKEQLLAQKNLA